MEALKNYFKKFIEERKNWDNCLKPDSYYLSISYMLIKNKYYNISKSGDPVYDIMVVYDNLIVNNELINHDNISDYDFETLSRIEKKFNRKNGTIKKLIQEGYHVLLNYYNNKNCLIDCFIIINPNYLYFDKNFNFIKPLYSKY